MHIGVAQSKSSINVGYNPIALAETLSKYIISTKSQTRRALYLR